MARTLASVRRVDDFKMIAIDQSPQILNVLVRSEGRGPSVLLESLENAPGRDPNSIQELLISVGLGDRAIGIREGNRARIILRCPGGLDPSRIRGRLS